MAALAGVESEQAAIIGRGQGRAAAALRADAASCLDALVAELAELGFDPAVADDGASTTIAFTHCPFRDLAEAFPELVCHLHRGIVEGMVEELGGARVDRFATLADRDPCHVELEVR
jgi:predicted ArsR family transcriptional regulator